MRVDVIIGSGVEGIVLCQSDDLAGVQTDDSRWIIGFRIGAVAGGDRPPPVDLVEVEVLIHLMVGPVVHADETGACAARFLINAGVPDDRMG